MKNWIEHEHWTEQTINTVTIRMKHIGRAIVDFDCPKASGEFLVASSTDKWLESFNVRKIKGQSIERLDTIASFETDDHLTQLTLLTFRHVRELMDHRLMGDEFYWNWLSDINGGNLVRLPHTRNEQDYNDYFFNEARFTSDHGLGDSWGRNVRSAFYGDEGLKWAHSLRLAVESRLSDDIDLLTKSLTKGGLPALYDSLTAIKRLTQNSRDAGTPILDESRHLDSESIMERWQGVLEPVIRDDLFKTISTIIPIWLNTVIGGVWWGQVSLELFKADTLRKEALDVVRGWKTAKYKADRETLGRYVLEASTTNPQGLVDFSAYQDLKEAIYLDTKALPNLIKTYEACLSSASSGLMLDVLRYLTVIRNLDPKVRLQNYISFKGGWSELAQNLQNEYQGKEVNKKRLREVFRFLKAYSTSERTGGQSFISWETNPGTNEVTIYYLGLMKDIGSNLQGSKLLGPWLHHPRGSTNQIRIHSFLAVSLSAWFTEYSVDYYKNPHLGLPLTDSLISYLQEFLGISKKSRVMKYLKNFEEDGAILITDDAWIKLGPRNLKEEKQLIEAGELRKARSIHGKNSARIRMEKVKKITQN